MKRNRFDKKVQRKLLRALDGLVKRFGLVDVRHAAAKFVQAQRVRASVEKERRRLRERLAELETKL